MIERKNQSTAVFTLRGVKSRVIQILKRGKAHDLRIARSVISIRMDTRIKIGKTYKIALLKSDLADARIHDDSTVGNIPQIFDGAVFFYQEFAFFDGFSIHTLF